MSVPIWTLPCIPSSFSSREINFLIFFGEGFSQYTLVTKKIKLWKWPKSKDHIWFPNSIQKPNPISLKGEGLWDFKIL